MQIRVMMMSQQVRAHMCIASSHAHVDVTGTQVHQIADLCSVASCEAFVPNLSFFPCQASSVGVSTKILLCRLQRNRQSPGKCKSRKAVSRLMLRLLAAGTLLVSSASGFALSSGSRHASVSSRRAVDAVVMKGAYDFSAKRLGTDATVNLSEFEGKVALIVNVASK